MLGLILTLLVFVILAHAVGEAASFIEKRELVRTEVVKALARENETQAR